MSNRNDPHHEWAVALMKQVRAPLLTTEPVLTEVAYFLRADRVDVDVLFQLLERNVLRVELTIAGHWASTAVTHATRYKQMDLADASIVALSERQIRSQVLTRWIARISASIGATTDR